MKVIVDDIIHFQTRKHSSRMHTTRFDHQMSVSVRGVCPQMNKFEQVSSDGHQMSKPRDPKSDTWEGLGLGGGGCTVRSNASWVMAI